MAVLAGSGNCPYSLDRVVDVTPILGRGIRFTPSFGSLGSNAGAAASCISLGKLAPQGRRYEAPGSSDVSEVEANDPHHQAPLPMDDEAICAATSGADAATADAAAADASKAAHGH